MKKKIIYKNGLTIVFICLFQVISTGNAKMEKNADRISGKNEYKKYLSDPRNKLIQFIDLHKLKITAQYLPAEFYNQTANQGKKKNKVTKDAQGLVYFLVRISPEEGVSDSFRNISNTDQARYYFTYDAQKDFSLVYNNNQVCCVQYTFEPSLDITPYIQFVLGFPLQVSKKSKDDLSLQYSDKLYQLGNISLRFNAKVISQIPKLKK